MLAPFLIMLREGLEASLIVGIIAGYLSKTGRGNWMPAVWIGVFLAVAFSLFTGAVLQLVSASFPQQAQEFFEAIVGIIAVIVLLSMVLWMRQAARTMGRDLRTSVDRALADGRAAPEWALVAMVFLAVAREGLETVFFLLAIFQQSTDASAPLGALFGLIISAVVGYGIYAGSLKLHLGLFFRWTGVFIIFVAAGLLAGSLKALHEAGVWNLLQAQVYDLSAVLPETSPLGTVLSGLLGYRDAPTLGEAVVYVVFLVAALYFFLRPHKPAAPAGAVASS